MKVLKLFTFIILLFLFSCAEDESSDSNTDSTSDTLLIAGSNILKSINLDGITTLALKPRAIQVNNYRSVSQKSLNQAPEICNELGAIEGDQYTELTVEGATPCFSEVEIWKAGHIYAKYFLEDQTTDTPTKYSFITDASGDVHHLPGHPKKKNSFKKSKIVDTYNGKPVYINHQGKLVSFDISTDAETILIDEAITNYSIKEYNNGSHFIVDATSGVKQIKPDKSEKSLIELTKGEWYHIDNSIQYQPNNSAEYKNLKFDSSGDIIDRPCIDIMNCTAIPETMELFINDYSAYLALGIGSGMPHAPYRIDSTSNCTNNMIDGQRLLVCNGKAYIIRGINYDLKELNWCKYGHCSLNSWLTIEICTTQSYIYFYGESDTWGGRLTRINDSTIQYDHILDTYQITDLECISDSEVIAVGTIGELTETISITDADTVSPLVSVIDSKITEIITE